MAGLDLSASLRDQGESCVYAVRHDGIVARENDLRLDQPVKLIDREAESVRYRRAHDCDGGKSRFSHGFSAENLGREARSLEKRFNNGAISETSRGFFFSYRNKVVDGISFRGGVCGLEGSHDFQHVLLSLGC